jgi:hypothetical protein
VTIEDIMLFMRREKNPYVWLIIERLYVLRSLLKHAAPGGVICAGQRGTDNPATFLTGVIVLLCMMMTITSFFIVALANWDRYALSMPVSKKKIVASKFLLSRILCLSGLCFISGFQAILKITGPVEGFSECLNTCIPLSRSSVRLSFFRFSFCL